MATYGGAVDLILTELARSDNSLTAVIEREILKAIEYYSPTRFWFNEARGSFTASNTIYYPLATVFPATASFMAGYLEVDQVSVIVNGSTLELEPEGHQTLQRLDVTGYTGYPTKWALFAESLRLYPKPAAGTTYQIEVLGTRRLATLSASTESNAWTLEALDLIASRVEKNICLRKFKDFDAAKAYSLSEDEQLQRLTDRTDRYMTVGKLKPG